MKAYLELCEIALMEKAATCLRDKLLIRVLFHLGCRVSEAIALTVQDIDLQQGTATIQHLKTRLNLTCPNCNTRLGRSHIFCPGCGGKVGKVVKEQYEQRRRRILPVDDDTLVLLEQYIRLGGPVLRYGKRLIFGINRHRAWQIVSECAERTGLPRLVNPETGKEHNISPHRLRDAFAVHAVKLNDSGDGLRMLQEHLGHASISTTMRYRKISGDEHKQWYDKLWQDKDTK